MQKVSSISNIRSEILRQPVNDTASPYQSLPYDKNFLLEAEDKAGTAQQTAWQLINSCGIRQAWENIGAKVHLIGSLATGLLIKKRDIDFHIHTGELDTGKSFAAINEICRGRPVTRLKYRNLASTDEDCLEWHVWCMFNHEEWQIDMIQIRRGSRFDGYFEHIADRINAVLTPETRLAILALKYLTPENTHISGIEYYRAVLEGKVRSWQDFILWREQHPLNGIAEWCP